MPDATPATFDRGLDLLAKIFAFVNANSATILDLLQKGKAEVVALKNGQYMVMIGGLGDVRADVEKLFASYDSIFNPPAPAPAAA